MSEPAAPTRSRVRRYLGIAAALLVLASFDVKRLARDQALQHRLCALMPGWPWEVTNQAGVHLWFEQHFGHPVAPLASLADAVATWPEYATAVAVTLEQDDTISIIAPYGLSDLFTMTVRHNPARASVATYRERVAQKKYRDRWPGVTIIDAEC